MMQPVIAFNTAAPTVADLILSGSVFSVLWNTQNTSRKCVGTKIMCSVKIVAAMKI